MKFNSETGLSLLELLIALLLLSSITIGLLSATQLGVRLLDRAEQSSEHQTELALRVRLRNWMERMQRPDPRLEFPTHFVGKTNSFAFTTISGLSAFPDATALRIEVVAETDALEISVVALDWSGNELDRFEETLAQTMGSIDLSYFDATANSNTWSETWDNRNKLPNLVRIEVDGSSEPDWPKFTVRTLASQ